MRSVECYAIKSFQELNHDQNYETECILRNSVPNRAHNITRHDALFMQIKMDSCIYIN